MRFGASIVAQSASLCLILEYAGSSETSNKIMQKRLAKLRASIRFLKLMLHVAFNAAIRSRSFSEFAGEPFNRGCFLQFVGPYAQDIFQIGRIGLTGVIKSGPLARVGARPRSKYFPVRPSPREVGADICTMKPGLSGVKSVCN